VRIKGAWKKTWKTVPENPRNWREREELKTFCQKAKDSFEKNAENLRQKWSEEFDNFTDNLNDKADDISSELQREINGLGHLETLKKSLKINREIEKMLKKVLRDELETLNSKLDNLIGKFAKNLESDIDDVFRVHANTFSGKNSLKDVISILLGDIIAAGGTAGGGAIIANALAPIGGVIAPGILAKLGFVFTGSVLAPALFAAIVPVAGGLTLAILATIIGAGLTRNMSEEQVYIIVKKALEEAIEDAKKSSNENLDKTLSRFKEELDSVLSQKLNDLDTVIKAIKEHNQKVKMQEIDSNLAGIKNISEELDRFINQANAG
jgi:predicted RNase H-like nuclease (RuvC/YqgF family)